MATPDVRSLYELYRQIYGSQGSLLDGPQPEAKGLQFPGRAYTQQAEGPSVSGDYAPVGGVLGRSNWSQDTGAVTAAPNVVLAQMPLPLPRARPFGPIPPTGPRSIQESPNLQLPELHIPESVRDAWVAGTLLPWTAWRRMQGDGKPNGSTQEPGDVPSPNTPLGPPNGGPGPQAGILGLLAEAARRQSPSNDDEARSSEHPDPNYRELTRVPSPTYEWLDSFKRPLEGQATEGTPPEQFGRAADSRGAAASGSNASRKSSSEIESPPLVPDQEPPASASYDGGGAGGGGAGGNRSGGPDDNERGKECTERWLDEIENWCRQFWFIHPKYGRECKDRAKFRLQSCHGNAPEELDRYSMREVDPDDVKRFLARQRAEAKKRMRKRKKR